MSIKASRATQTKVDVIIITPELVAEWKNPPFQRPCRVNDKVRELAQQIAADGAVLPGIITIGILGKDSYLIDGQHRREAFLLSGAKEGYTEVRYHTFESMDDMGAEFVRLNSSLVRLRPDDVLRGLEGTNEALKLIRKRCPFVGYDMVRRGATAPVVSMSTAIRCWAASSGDVPSSGGAGVAVLARGMSAEAAAELADFLTIAMHSWGRDHEYARLWGGLNMTICMWTFRRIVLGTGLTVQSRLVRLTADQFRNCMTSLSADSRYIDWLLGRKMGDRDRSPAYARIKQIFVRRLAADTGKRATLPAPAWSHHTNIAPRVA